MSSTYISALVSNVHVQFDVYVDFPARLVCQLLGRKTVTQLPLQIFLPVTTRIRANGSCNASMHKHRHGVHRSTHNEHK